MQQPFFTTCILRKFSSLWSGPFSWQHNDVHTVALEKDLRQHVKSKWMSVIVIILSLKNMYIRINII